MSLKEIKDGDKIVLKDPDSGINVARIKKAYSYGREYEATPHPDLSRHFPSLSLEHSYYGVGSEFRKQKENKSSLIDHIDRIFRNYSNSDFKNKVNVTKQKIEDGEGTASHVYTFHDSSTGDKMGHTNKHGDLRIDPEYIKKHNIDESVFKSKTSLPWINQKKPLGQHVGDYSIKIIHPEFENLTDIKGKKTTLAGLKQSSKEGYSNYHKTYRINGTHEEGSASHERHLLKSGYEINRTSPTSFNAVKRGAEYLGDSHVSSYVHGNILHAAHTNIRQNYEYEPKNEDLIENVLHLIEYKYNYIQELAKIIRKY